MLRREQQVTRDLDFRCFHLRAETVNESARTVDAVVTTETAVREWDWERWRDIPRTLLMSGAKFPGQVPLLDSHNRYSTRNQLGSIRNLRIENDKLVGTLHFSSQAEDAFTKVREGHITDVSAGFVVEEEQYVKPNERATVSGREFEGEINVATRWALREGSLVPIGADEAAKLRGVDLTRRTKKEAEAMSESLVKLLKARGLPDGLSDADLEKWIDKHLSGQVPVEPVRESKPANDGTPQPPIGIDEAVARALENYERKKAAHRKEVQSLCEIGRVEPDEDMYAMADYAEVRKAIRAKQDASERLANEELVGTGVKLPPVQPRDRHIAAMRTALSMRAVNSITSEESARKLAAIEAVIPESSRAKDWQDFRNMPLIEIARRCLVADGFSEAALSRVSREEMAIAAMGWPQKTGLRSDAALHVTGSFAELTLDAVNKSMMVGYREAPQTWRGPMRQGTSVPDFKQIHRVVLGAVPNLPIWPDNTEPEQASFADAKESYAVECRSSWLSFSYRLLVNDDMDALGRIPGGMGQAAGRTVNAVAWEQVTSNPTLRDAVALFSTATGARKRSNLTSTGGTFSITNLQTMTNLMMQMRGENTPEGNESDDILALMPAYVIGPSALRTTILQIVLSVADVSKSNDITYNPARNLIPVIEPRLDANSTTAYYVFADPAQIDTIEVTFLQGQEQPVVRDFMDEKTLSQNYIVMQTFAAKAMDHRGVQKHTGGA